MNKQGEIYLKSLEKVKGSIPSLAANDLVRRINLDRRPFRKNKLRELVPT